MGFQLYFAGLTCLIKDSASEYTVIWPETMKNTIDPCNGKTTIHPHETFLIVPKLEMATSQIPGRILNGCFIASLAGFKKLSSAATDTAGSLVDGDLKDGYHWSDFDKTFDPDKTKAAMTMSLKRGTMASQSVPFVKVPKPEERSIFTAIDVPSMATSHVFMIDTFKVVVEDNARVLIANVAAEWIDDADYPDDDDHFNLYYKLSKNAAGCVKPTPKVAPDLISTHPYLSPNRSLRISCSNTMYP